MTYFLWYQLWHPLQKVTFTTSKGKTGARDRQMPQEVALDRQVCGAQGCTAELAEENGGEGARTRVEQLPRPSPHAVPTAQITRHNTGTQQAHNTGSCTQGTHLAAVGDVRANLLHQVKDMLRQGSLRDLMNGRSPKQNRSQKPRLGSFLLPSLHPTPPLSRAGQSNGQTYPHPPPPLFSLGSPFTHWPQPCPNPAPTQRLSYIP